MHNLQKNDANAAVTTIYTFPIAVIVLVYCYSKPDITVPVSDAGVVTVQSLGPDVSILAELMYDHRRHVPSQGHTAIVHSQILALYRERSFCMNSHTRTAYY